MASIATLDNVSYLYPRSDEPVLRDVSLEIARGEFLGLIGPTGAGKTTLCLTLNGIVPQFYGGRFFGRVTVAGLDSLDHPISTMAQHVGMVFEDPETQITATSVENEIAFGMENLRVPREEIEARIPRILEAVRLTGSEKKRPDELSGGEKQRLAIAAALGVAARPPGPRRAHVSTGSRGIRGYLRHLTRAESSTRHNNRHRKPRGRGNGGVHRSRRPTLTGRADPRRLTRRHLW